VREAKTRAEQIHVYFMMLNRDTGALFTDRKVRAMKRLAEEMPADAAYMELLMAMDRPASRRRAQGLHRMGCIHAGGRRSSMPRLELGLPADQTTSDMPHYSVLSYELVHQICWPGEWAWPPCLPYRPTLTM
jgi:hypothetical protein